MKHERKFIIQVKNIDPPPFLDAYIRIIYKTFIGYYYIKTYKIKHAKKWKYKKTCDNIINKIENDLDPTKESLKHYTLKTIEITDKKTLRKIKLKKLQK